MGIASLILGICGFTTFCIPCFSQILAVLGFIFGLIDIIKKSNTQEKKVISVVGIILSSIALVVGTLWIIFFVIPTIPELLEIY